MLPGLPEPRRDQLRHAPLELVVCQLRFGDVVARASEPSIGPAFQRAVGALVGSQPALERVAMQDLLIALGAGAAQSGLASQPEPAFRLVVPGGVFTLSPTALAVETTSYTRWSEFRELFHGAVSFVSEALTPPSEARLGLRMINRLSPDRVSSPSGFAEMLQAWISGPLQDAPLGASVAAFQQQYDFRSDGENQLALRSAVFRDQEKKGRPTLILDYDAFRTGYRPFDAGDITSTSDALNDFVLQVFQRSLTPAFYEELLDADVG